MAFKSVLLVPVLIGLSACSSMGEGPAKEERHEVGRFFEHYQHLMQEFSPDVIDLYADTAKLHGTKVMRDGTERMLSLSGSQYKKRFPTLIKQAEAMDDRSDFKDIEITMLRESQAKIMAQRYSLNKCYTDDEYYMVVKNEGGRWLIIEEYVTTQQAIDC